MAQATIHKWEYANIDMAFADEVVKGMRSARVPGFEGTLKYAIANGKGEAEAIKNKFQSVRRSDRAGKLKVNPVRQHIRLGSS